MTKDDVQMLLSKRIEEAKKERDTVQYSYWTGVIRGLYQAKELVGMLDCKNNHL